MQVEWQISSAVIALCRHTQGSWASRHLGLIFGIIMAALAGVALWALGCCCVLRCRRRVRQGRGGASLPSWLLPTPSPQPPRARRSSPLGLRSKYSSEILPSSHAQLSLAS